MDKSLLSIVIANYNYGRFLEEAIQSVLAQGMGDKIELIICDAASTDNSVEIIKKYEKHIAWWCSEPDGGQSEAFNKGFAHAKGEWFTWLNADEFYLPNTLKKFAALVARKPQAKWITGNMLSFDSETRRILRVNWGPHKQPPFLAPQHTFDAVFGTTTFWHRSLRDKFGPIDEKLIWGMDIEYWKRFTFGGVKQTRLNHICWAFRCHNESKTGGCAPSESVISKARQEAEYILNKTGGPFNTSIRNIWYDIWVLWRFFDGSWAVRAWKKIMMEGRTVDKYL